MSEESAQCILGPWEEGQFLALDTDGCCIQWNTDAGEGYNSGQLPQEAFGNNVSVEDVELYSNYVLRNAPRSHPAGWYPVCFAEFLESEEIEEDRIRTHLTAAAPDLLEALEHISQHPSCTQCADAARAAIAKATSNEEK